MTVTTAYEDFTKLRRSRGDLQFPVLEQTSLSCETRDLSADEMGGWRDGFAAERGWIMGSSGVCRFSARSLVWPPGMVLRAEFALTDHISLHVQHLGAGQWRHVTMTDGKDGEETLRDTVRVIADGGTQWLIYHRYWRWDDGLGLYPFLAAFKGWET